MWIMVTMIAAAGAQGAPDRADLDQVFRAMDRNGDGYVSTNEEPQARNERSSTGRWSVRTVGSWVARYDRNGDARVSRREFVDGAAAEIAAYSGGRGL